MRCCDGFSEKSHTIQVFHTAHIVLDRERNSNVTSHYISAFVLLNMSQPLFPSYNFLTGNPVREHCLLPPRNGPGTVAGHFFQTFQEIFFDLNISALLCIVQVPHLTIYCFWLNQRGGVVIGVTVLQPDGLGSIPLDSQNPPC